MKKCCSENENINPEKINFENLEGLICYCFNHSKKELFESIKNQNEMEVVNDIKSKMKDPGCFCETANPSGKCCLADVMTFIKVAKN